MLEAAEVTVRAPITRLLRVSARRVYEHIQGRPGCTAEQIRGALGLSKSTVGHHVASLVALGLVRQVQSEHDRREWHLHAVRDAR